MYKQNQDILDILQYGEDSQINSCEDPKQRWEILVNDLKTKFKSNKTRLLDKQLKSEDLQIRWVPSSEEIESAFRSLPRNKAVSIDGLEPNTLRGAFREKLRLENKQLEDQLSSDLRDRLTQVEQQCQLWKDLTKILFQGNWKYPHNTGRLILLKKTQDAQDLNGIRTITVTPLLMKVVEKILWEKVKELKLPDKMLSKR